MIGSEKKENWRDEKEILWDLINQFGFTSFAYLIMANQLVRFSFSLSLLSVCGFLLYLFNHNIIEDPSTRAHRATPSPK